MTPLPCVFWDDPLPVELEDPHRELGGKGTSLRQLHKAGVRVPRGFTIGSSVCRHFLDHDEWPDCAWPGVIDAVQRLGKHLEVESDGQNLSPHGLRLAVRSGAAVSMPGLLRTHRDVTCDPVPAGEQPTSRAGYDALRRAIEDIFRSWNSEGVERYRQMHGVDHQMATAVTVQEMIDCTASGVMMTQFPGADGDLVIEAVAGCGESLVSGRMTPQRWVVRRFDQQILSAPDCPGGPFAALQERLQELVVAGLQLEREFGEPLDVEWGLDERGFVYFQARAVSQSVTMEDSTTGRDLELARLRQMTEAGTRFWVRHNLGETLSNPTPLTWSVWRQFMSGGGGLGTLYRQLGYRPGRRVQSESFLTLIGGQVYADPDRAVVMFGEAYPWTYDIDELCRDPSALEHAPRHFDPARLDPFFLWRLPGLAWRMWRAQRRIAQLMHTAIDRFEQQIVPSYLQFVANERAVNLSSLDADRLPGLFESRRSRVMGEFGPESLLPGTLGAIAMQELTRQVTRILGPQQGERLIRELMPVGDGDLLQRQQHLLSLVRDEATTATFVKEFGHRAIGEMELATPRWRETPELIARLPAAVTPKTPFAIDEGHSSADAGRVAAERRLRQAFADAGAASLLSPTLMWLDRCRRLLPYRDRGKHLLLMGYELLRDVSQEMSRRFALGDDIYYLTSSEWPDLIAGRDMQSRIRDRRRQAAFTRGLRLPDVIDADRLADVFAGPPDVKTSNMLQGTSLAAGYGRGMVWNMVDSVRPVGNSRSVLVCKALEPSLSPLLAGVSAVIVEQGGTLSHGATLARGIGLPVVRMTDATRLLADNQTVSVDGQTGRIEITGEVSP